MTIFEKYKIGDKLWDILKIVLSFCLIYVLGVQISHNWQIKEYRNQSIIEQKKYEKEVATKVFEELSKQLDRQVSNFQFLLKDQSFKQKCREDYLNWNENKTRLKALTESYFGKSASQSLIYFNNQFQALFFKLVVDPKKSEYSVDTTTSVNLLENDIFDFNSKLIDDLLLENFGSYREKPENNKLRE